MSYLTVTGRALSAARHISNYAVTLALCLAIVSPSAGHGQRRADTGGTLSIEELRRLVAPSPQRELFREWEDCAVTLATLMVPQGSTMDQIQAMLQISCSDKESRLTGALSREYGSEVGNSAILGLRAALRSRLEAAIAARDNPQPAPGQLAQLPGGWIPTRIGPNNCFASHSYQDFPESRIVMVSKSPRVAQAIFMTLGSAAQREAQRFGTGTRIVAQMATFQGMAGTPQGELQLTVMERDNALVLIANLDDKLLEMLSNADEIQLGIRFAGSMIALPQNYRIQGVRTAWAAVIECAQR